MIRTAFVVEESHGRIGLAAIGRASDRHFGGVNSGSVAEEDHDVAVKEIAPGIERQGRVGPEVDAVRSLVRR